MRWSNQMGANVAVVLSEHVLVGSVKWRPGPKHLSE